MKQLEAKIADLSKNTGSTAKLTTDKKTLSKQKSSLEKEKTSLEAEIVALKEKVASAEKELKKTRENKELSDRAAQQTSREATQTLEKLAEVEKEILRLNSENSRKEVEIKGLREQLIKSKGLVQAMNAPESISHELEKKLKLAENKFAEEHAVSNQKIAALESSLASQKEHSEELQNLVQQLQTSIKVLQEIQIHIH